jgi:SAM-dependent methyltransferase
VTGLGRNGAQLLRERYRTDSNLSARLELHRRFSTNPQDWHGWVFDQLPTTARMRLLEVGSGTGALWERNRERIPAGWAMVLTDLSPGMLEGCRSRLAPSISCEFTQADASELPFGDRSFDVAVANHMLYHVRDLGPALGGIRRILDAGGRLYAATNGAGHMAEIDLLMTEEAGVANPASHMDRFRLENGAEALRRWFDDVELRLYDSSLEVTEVEPVLRYILSMSTGLDLADEAVARIGSRVQGEIEVRGSFHVSKRTGLFVAAA